MKFEASQFPLFNGDLNASIYEEYFKINKYSDYLQHNDINSLRDPNLQPCGLKNLGNTCYFNVILQILYSINYLRNDLVMTYNGNNNFLKSLKRLFGLMSKGKFIFADPTQVFQQLKKSKNELFNLGIQNDFNEVFSFFIEQLQKSYTDSDLKTISKIFTGKLHTKIIIQENNIRTKQSKFNVLNLNCQEENFQQALNAFRYYEIPEYQKEDGKMTSAKVQNIFAQTPALMAFFINRVTFKQGFPVKNAKPFAYKKTIFLAKKNSSTVKNTQKQIQKLDQQIKQLQNWIIKIQQQKRKLIEALSYLDGKQFSLINLPTIHNPQNQQSYNITKRYLCKEIQQIESICAQKQKQIQKNLQYKQKLAHENDTQLYTLFALMIHQGKSATSGHYKVCINTSEHTWVEFNDRRTNKINEEKIKQFHQKGEICCLFYKRASLIVDSTKVTINGSLKKQVFQIQNQLKHNIDKIRIQQAILSKKQQLMKVVQIQRSHIKENQHLYFLKPIKYFIQEQKSSDSCINALLSQKIQQVQFKRQLQEKLFNKSKIDNLPTIELNLSETYGIIHESLKKFLSKQLHFETIVEAYQNLLDLVKMPIQEQKMSFKFTLLVKLLFIKGVFYYLLCDQYKFPQKTELSKILNQIFQTINHSSVFLLNFIEVLDDKQRIRIIQKVKKFPKKNNQQSINNYCDLLEMRFKHWIIVLSKVDSMTKNQIYEHSRNHFNQYITNDELEQVKL